MKRRDFIAHAGSATAMALVGAHAPGFAQGLAARAPSASGRILVLVELKGGNDGLNTVVPYADPHYAQLRGTIAVGRDSVIPLDEQSGLHIGLAPLMPLWEKGELAIVQGVGYPQPNLSHFRSIEIWETGSNAGEYLQDGWVARAMKAGYASTARWTAEGVVVGQGGQGPLAGARAISLTNPEAFVRGARIASAHPAQGNAAMRHLLEVESDVQHAAEGLAGEPFPFRTAFPEGAFGNAVRAAAQVAATQRARGGIPVMVLSLGSFDTHQNQPATHASLLRQLGSGLAALREAMTELGLWDRTLVMTFSEFGRRARQNQSNGTDHGTAAPHFVAGGAVRGGLVGAPPDLERLDGEQNLVHTTDFRQLYAAIARDWWGVRPETVVRGAFEPLRLLRA